MTQQIINVGAVANDGTGESLRSAFQAVNDNFSNVWAQGPVDSQVVISNNVISTNVSNQNLVIQANGIGVITVASSVVPGIDSVWDLGAANAQYDSVYARYYYGDASNMTGLPQPTDLGAVNTDILPIATQAFNIGSQTQQWQKIYAGGIVAGNTSIITINVGNLHIPGGTNGYVLQTDGTGNLSWTAQTGGSGNGTPGGSNTQIQFNDAGAFGGQADFTFNKVSNVITVPGNIIPNNNSTQSLGNATHQWKDLWVSNSSIYLNSVPLTLVAGNTLTIGGNPIVTVTANNVANVGNFVFNGNSLENINGSSFDNGSLTNGPTAQLSLPANGNTSYVAVYNSYGNIVLRSGSNAVVTAQWNFNNDGTLATQGNISANAVTLSGELIFANGLGAVGEVGYGFSGPAINAYTGKSVSIRSNDQAYSWNFGTAGNLTLPDGSVINAGGLYGNGTGVLGNRSGDNKVYAQASGVGIQTNNGNINNTWFYDRNGNLTLPGNTFAVNYANGTQVNVAAGVIQSNVAPGSPTDQTLWYDEVSGRLYVWYNDGVSTQWVDASPAPTTTFTNITSNIIPAANVTYSLGNSTNWWANAWFASNTIYIGGVPVGVSANTLTVNGANVVTANTGGTLNASNISVTGNITAAYFVGNGSQLTGLPASYGNSNVANFMASFGSNSISTGGNVTANAVTLKNSDDFAQILFSNDGGSTNNGQIKVDGGTNMVISSGSNFYVKRAGQDRIAVTDTTADFMATTNVRIQSNKAGSAQTWLFDTTGNLTLPTNTSAINYANGSSILSGAGGSYGDSNVATFLAAYGSNTISTLGNITGGNLIATANVLGNGYGKFAGSFDESQAATAGLYLGYAGGTPRMMFGTGNTQQTFEIDNDGGTLRFYQPGSTKASLYSDGAFSAAGNVSGSNLFATSVVSAAGNVRGGNINTAGIVSAAGNVYAGSYVGDGSVLSNVATQVKSSWTVTSGSGSYSFTVPANNTYQLWVRGNIPNGIIVYTATAAISNTNVPVLGVQYGWNYIAGGNLILDSLPSQFVGTAGLISNAAPAVSNTNVFTFGITNNSGSSQTVEYGWTKIS